MNERIKSFKSCPREGASVILHKRRGTKLCKIIIFSNQLHNIRYCTAIGSKKDPKSRKKRGKNVREPPGFFWSIGVRVC